MPHLTSPCSAASVSGSKLTLSNITASGLGCGALLVSGGDVMTLASSHNVVANCTVTRYGRFNRAYVSPLPLAPQQSRCSSSDVSCDACDTCYSYHAGIHWAGVGHTISGNSISHAPHNGMLGGGNDNVFTGNTFDTLCYEATDSGAWCVQCIDTMCSAYTQCQCINTVCGVRAV